jgi:hypothetical protein
MRKIILILISLSLLSNATSDDKFYKLNSIQTCDGYSCIYGKCTDEETCICSKCYTTIPSFKDDYRKCNYKQGRAYVAFAWEMVLPIGFGHYYLGNIIFGLMKMFLMCTLCCVPYFYPAYSLYYQVINIDENSYRLIYDVPSTLLVAKALILKSQFLMLVIYLLDLFLMLTIYTDGNGVPLC